MSRESTKKSEREKEIAGERENRRKRVGERHREDDVTERREISSVEEPLFSLKSGTKVRFVSLFQEI